MNHDPTRRRLLAGGAAAALTSLAGCTGLTPFVGTREEETRTVALEDAESLAVVGQVGDVTLRAADRSDVRVHTVKQSSSVTADVSKLSLAVERADGRLVLRTEWSGGGDLFGGRPSMSLDVRVPRSLAVARAATNVGDLRVTDAAGDLDATTDVGDVTIDGVSGTVTGESSTGDVEIRSPDVLGDVRTETGDLTVDAPALAGDTRIESETGDVDLAVADSVGAELSVRTETGDVSVSGLELSDSTRAEHVVTGTLGDGGPSLTVRTETGDVSVTAMR
ncbi:DUF4097 family beta strand repeat-containing protein [Halorarum halobium]|uniref:DUF4097 family beta strand repeat-containing protein n=1 Tax=Halorarum halobium TaxID=3075121 RepID=UPI0028A62ACA|nr:DUF4097 family beta strand repeat-containing protein [Halobaculum sp. XH14]